MKRFKFSFLPIIAVLLLTQFGFSQKTEESFVKGELLVKFKAGIKDSFIENTNRQINSQAAEKFPRIGWQRIKLPEDISFEKARNYYESLPEVEAVQPNYYYRLAVTPNDQRFGNLYGMNKISAPAAWDLTTGSSEVIVAVIDTGIKYTHEDLAANMWKNKGEIPNNGIDDDGNGFIDDYYGYDFRFNDSDPNDEYGHGTHVAGTIGAVGNNSIGVVGVNWNVRLMAVKIYDATGSGTTSAMLINAYNYVTLMRERGENIRVTNNSYSGCDEACGYDQATKDALDAMGNAGILNVFAAGNSNLNADQFPAYPGSYDSPDVLTVAASTSTDSRSGFSNYGTNSVDLAAPGSGIHSTVISSIKYGNSNGTSMASPHVAGAAALLSAYNPNLSSASLKASLMNNVDKLTNWSGLVKTGGRLNVFRALQNQTVCNFELSQTSIDARTKGGIYSINVTAGQNCDFSVRSESNWIHLLNSTNSFTGNNTVKFRVTVNPTISRSATVSIAGQNITVTQSRN